MSSMLYVHRSYGCRYWPRKEDGPVAIYHRGPSESALSAYEWVVRISRMVSSGPASYDRLLEQDIRLGVIPTTPRKVVLVGKWDGGRRPREFPVRYAATSKRAVLTACAKQFAAGADLVIVLDPRRTCPAWTIKKTAGLILDAAFGGGVYHTEDSFVEAFGPARKGVRHA